MNKGQTTIHKTPHRNEQYVPHNKIGINSGAPEVPVPLVTPVVLQFKDANFHLIWKSCQTLIYVNQYRQHIHAVPS